MPDPVPTPTPPPDPTQAFQSLLSKHNNDATALAAKLFDENYAYREQIRGFKDKAPKEGDVVLAGDDAKEWTAFKALDLKAGDLKKSLDRLPDLEKQNKELAGMENLREVSELGLEGSKMKTSVLKDLLASKFPDAVITFKTEKDKDGKEAKVAFIQKTDKDPVTSFAEFAKAEFSDYLPSLTLSHEANPPVPPGSTHDPKPQGGAISIFDQIREDAKKTGEAPQASIDDRFGRASASAS